MDDMGANMGKTNGGSLLENLALPSTHPTLHIVMLGLDSAGKTTALYRLKFDQYVNTVRYQLSLECSRIILHRLSHSPALVYRSRRSASIAKRSEPYLERPRVLNS